MDRYSTPTNEHEARVYLAKLVRHFKTSKVQLIWSERMKNGLYNDARWHPEIRVGPRSWRGLKPALVHEFAHHLVGKLPTRAHHGKKFKKALMRVVKYCYEDPTDYPWQSEYEGVKQHGVRRLKLTVPPPYVDPTIYPHELHKFVQLPLNLMEGVE